MNLNISPDSMRDLVTLVLAARDEVLEEMPPRVSPEAQAQAAAPRPSDEETVDDLLSGVPRPMHRR